MSCEESGLTGWIMKYRNKSLQNLSHWSTSKTRLSKPLRIEGHFVHLILGRLRVYWWSSGHYKGLLTGLLVPQGPGNDFWGLSLSYVRAIPFHSLRTFICSLFALEIVLWWAISSVVQHIWMLTCTLSFWFFSLVELSKGTKPSPVYQLTLNMTALKTRTFVQPTGFASQAE